MDPIRKPSAMPTSALTMTVAALTTALKTAGLAFRTVARAMNDHSYARLEGRSKFTVVNILGQGPHVRVEATVGTNKPVWDHEVAAKVVTALRAQGFDAVNGCEAE